MYSDTTPVILGIQNFSWIIWTALLTPKCPLLSWYMVKISGTMASGTQTFPPLQITRTFPASRNCHCPFRDPAKWVYSFHQESRSGMTARQESSLDSTLTTLLQKASGTPSLVASFKAARKSSLRDNASGTKFPLPALQCRLASGRNSDNLSAHLSCLPLRFG